MTIGVAASGTNAGEAVRAAVLAGEVLGKGAIGGFAVFAAMLNDGQVVQRVTQRGGIVQLDIPGTLLQATRAAAISSGPDRPEPLQQFLPGRDGIGMVSGHRLPNRAGNDGVPLNMSVLRRLEKGEMPQDAVEAVLDANPESDAGLMAIDQYGRIGWGNSQRVSRRADLGSFNRVMDDRRLAILHNSIHFMRATEQIVGTLAWNCLSGQTGRYSFLSLKKGALVRLATCDRLHLDAQGKISLIETADWQVARMSGRATVVYLGTQVWQAGHLLGHVVSELMAEVSGGTVQGNVVPASGTVILEKDGHVAS